MIQFKIAKFTKETNKQRILVRASFLVYAYIYTKLIKLKKNIYITK